MSKPTKKQRKRLRREARRRGYRDLGAYLAERQDDREPEDPYGGARRADRG